MDEENIIYHHDLDPDIFRESLSYSEAVTGFTANLIEKDYYISLILHYLFKDNSPLVFKGGTCLSKVYADFYRLSEDLDFSVPASVDMPRNQRSDVMTPIKKIYNKLPEAIPGIHISKNFKGHNESRQYIGYLEYHSMVKDAKERIKIEIGIREPLYLPSVTLKTHTVAVNPFSAQSLLPCISVNAMDIKEAYAEKVRAALTRPEPAIRDFFDLYHAVQNRKLNLFDRDFLIMVKRKLVVMGDIQIGISLESKHDLDQQIEGQLRPVLRPTDFDSFNMDGAFNLITKIADAIKLK